MHQPVQPKNLNKWSLWIQARTDGKCWGREGGITHSRDAPRIREPPRRPAPTDPLRIDLLIVGGCACGGNPTELQLPVFSRGFPHLSGSESFRFDGDWCSVLTDHNTASPRQAATMAAHPYPSYYSFLSRKGGEQFQFWLGPYTAEIIPAGAVHSIYYTYT
jgi:hypothetical protein